MYVQLKELVSLGAGIEARPRHWKYVLTLAFFNKKTKRTFSFLRVDFEFCGILTEEQFGAY